MRPGGFSPRKRRKLLENFDEEVQEKLRIKDRESSDYLSKFENWLWQLTHFYLRDYAEFGDGGRSFVLARNPFPEENIHPGPYPMRAAAPISAFSPEREKRRVLRVRNGKT